MELWFFGVMRWQNFVFLFRKLYRMSKSEKIINNLYDFGILNHFMPLLIILLEWSDNAADEKRNKDAKIDSLV